MDDRFLTTDELAKLLKVPVETLRTWRKAGRGPASFRIPGGRRILYATTDVEQWLASARG